MIGNTRKAIYGDLKNMLGRGIQICEGHVMAIVDAHGEDK